MKSKTSLYILLPLVIIIWGIVIFKVVGAVTERPETAINVPEINRFKNFQFEKDTFSLEPINQNPFLGHFYKKPDPVIKNIPPKSQIIWPTIIYLGLVSDSGESSKIHIVEINGKQLLFEKGSSNGEFILVGSRSNKVILSYKGERRAFIKKGVI